MNTLRVSVHLHSYVCHFLLTYVGLIYELYRFLLLFDTTYLFDLVHKPAIYTLIIVRRISMLKVCIGYSLIFLGFFNKKWLSQNVSNNFMSGF